MAGGKRVVYNILPISVILYSNKIVYMYNIYIPGFFQNFEYTIIDYYKLTYQKNTWNSYHFTCKLSFIIENLLM